MAVQFTICHGARAQEHLHELAKLRIQIFRAWPYLYAGDLDYEADYLQVYLRSERSIVILARAGDALIGASTGLPLSDENAAFQVPFLDANRAIHELFYFGESVLIPEFRGQGIGHRFFDLREQHAAQSGFSLSCFAAVRRHAEDLRRPSHARDLQPFWRARGYAPNGLSMRLAWRELGQDQDASNTLDFWQRRLGQ